MSSFKHNYRSLLLATLRMLKEDCFSKDILIAPEKTYLFFQTPSLTSPQEKLPPSPPEKKVFSIPIKKVVPQAPLTTRAPPEKKLPPKREEKEPAHSAPPPSNQGQDELRELLRKVAPKWTLREDIPSDALAKQIAHSWKHPRPTEHVILLSLDETEEELLFLKNLARAINDSLLPAKLIKATHLEQGKKWEPLLKDPHLRLILAPPTLARSLENSPHCSKSDKDNEHFLRAIPLLFLEPLSSYLKNPPLKRALWDLLCKRLKK